MNLDDIIEFEQENTNLDFKKEEYRKENYDSLIKDVMSMANSNTIGTKRIIIGVKDIFGGKREIVGLEKLTDQAVFEDVIQANIKPNITFRYYPYKYKGKLLGIIEITDNNDKPYMMKKKRGNLKENEIWIRKGSTQSIASREDLDFMYGEKGNNSFQNKVSIGFGDEMKNSIEIPKTNIKKENLPSQMKISDYKRLIGEIHNRYNANKSQSVKTTNANAGISGVLLFGKFRDSDKSIQIGKNEFNMPIYKNEEQLEELINSAQDDYLDEDYYYLYEECSYKFNCQIINDGTEFLEDVKIELFFDSEVFDIPDHIYEEPISYGILRPRIKPVSIRHYPMVNVEGDTIIVEEHHDKIRHKTLTDVFFSELRMIIKPNIKMKETEVKYRIGAKNLANHVEGSIVLKLV